MSLPRRVSEQLKTELLAGRADGRAVVGTIGEDQVQISVIHPTDLCPNEIAAWHMMQRKTRHLANPFLCPEFAVAVGQFRPAARVAVLSDGGEIVGFFPFERRRLGVGVPIGAGLTDCQGLIHAPGVAWDTHQLLHACKVAVWQFDNLVEGQRPFERYVAAVAPSPVIDLTDGFAAYEQKLRIKSPQFCRDIARRARKLDRETGGLRFTADSRNIGELRTLVRWKSDQYRRNGWSNIFDRPWVVDLIEYLFSTHSDRFGGLLSVLYAGETPVAAHFGLRGSNILAHWFPAYDPGFSKQSPGLIQHLRMAEETAAMGVHIIDMGTGPERYKQTLKSRDLFVSKGVVARSPSLASAYRARGALARWARHELKRYPSLFHAADRLLGHYGQIG